MNKAHASDTIEKAKRFAEQAHSGQTRKGAGAEPYVIHLAEVAELVTRFGGSETAILAAWLHDTVEDCTVTRADLVAMFGEAVAAVVMELTDNKSLPKPERKRLQIVNAPHKSPEAALVKLCDKMSNVCAVGVNPPLHWSQDRKCAYVDWAVTVADALPTVPQPARLAFAATVQATREALGT
jgi:(p)ppGpp synthase/HD superfamily hydrolase